MAETSTADHARAISISSYGVRYLSQLPTSNTRITEKQLCLLVSKKKLWHHCMGNSNGGQCLRNSCSCQRLGNSCSCQHLGNSYDCQCLGNSYGYHVPETMMAVNF